MHISLCHIFTAFVTVLFQVNNIKSCKCKLRFRRNGENRFELYHTEKVLKTKEMNFSKQHA